MCILGLDAKCIFYCREWLKEGWSTKRGSVPHTFLFHTRFSLVNLRKAPFVPHLRGALASHFTETVSVTARASTWLRPLRAGLLPPTCKELSSSPQGQCFPPFAAQGHRATDTPPPSPASSISCSLQTHSLPCKQVIIIIKTYLPSFHSGFWILLHISAPLHSKTPLTVSLPTNSASSLSFCPDPPGQASVPTPAPRSCSHPSPPEACTLPPPPPSPRQLVLSPHFLNPLLVSLK